MGQCYEGGCCYLDNDKDGQSIIVFQLGKNESQPDIKIVEHEHVYISEMTEAAAVEPPEEPEQEDLAVDETLEITPEEPQPEAPEGPLPEETREELPVEPE